MPFCFVPPFLPSFITLHHYPSHIAKNNHHETGFSYNVTAYTKRTKFIAKFAIFRYSHTQQLPNFLLPFLASFLYSASFFTIYSTLLKIITVQLINLAMSLHNFHIQTSSAIKDYYALRMLTCFLTTLLFFFVHHFTSTFISHCKNNHHATDYSCKIAAQFSQSNFISN